MIHHDSIFKELLSVFFKEFIEAFLPEVAAYIDFNSLILMDKETFPDATAGKRRESDLVVRAKFRDHEVFFLVHVEHQAHLEKDFGQRMFRYFVLLYLKYGLPVYPVVLFSHHRPKSQPDRFRVVFPDRQVLNFRYRVIQLSRMSWRRWLKQPNPAACALMSKMAIAPRDRPRVKLECLKLLVRLKLDPARTKLISGFVDTYLNLNAEEALIFTKQADRLLPPSEKENVMEIVTSWMKEGLKKGRQEAMCENVIEVLETRFGEVPFVLREQLGRIHNPLRLKSLLRRAVTAETLKEFQAHLPGQITKSAAVK
jgi:hypothetical protein